MDDRQKLLIETRLGFCPFCKKQFFGIKEIKILFAICIDGKNYQQIADEFGIMESTVRSHVRNIKAKIQLNPDHFKQFFSECTGFNLDNLGDFGGI